MRCFPAKHSQCRRSGRDCLPLLQCHRKHQFEPTVRKATTADPVAFTSGSKIALLRRNGKILVTLIDTPQVWQIDPKDDSAELVHEFPDAISALGIVEYKPDVFAIVGAVFVHVGCGIADTRIRTLAISRLVLLFPVAGVLGASISVAVSTRRKLLLRKS